MAINELLEFGRNLRRVRISRGYSQDKLAALSGVTQSKIAKIEAGGANPTVETLIALARGLNVFLRIKLEQGDRALEELLTKK